MKLIKGVYHWEIRREDPAERMVVTRAEMEELVRLWERGKVRYWEPETGDYFRFEIDPGDWSRPYLRVNPSPSAYIKCEEPAFLALDLSKSRVVKFSNENTKYIQIDYEDVQNAIHDYEEQI